MKSNYREMPVDELESEVQKLRNEIFLQRSQTADSKEKKGHLIQQNKKKVAQIKTVLKERKLNEVQE